MRYLVYSQSRDGDFVLDGHVLEAPSLDEVLAKIVAIPWGGWNGRLLFVAPEGATSQDDAVLVRQSGHERFTLTGLTRV